MENQEFIVAGGYTQEWILNSAMWVIDGKYGPRQYFVYLGTVEDFICHYGKETADIFKLLGLFSVESSSGIETLAIDFEQINRSKSKFFEKSFGFGKLVPIDALGRKSIALQQSGVSDEDAEGLVKEILQEFSKLHA